MTRGKYYKVRFFYLNYLQMQKVKNPAINRAPFILILAAFSLWMRLLLC